MQSHFGELAALFAAVCWGFSGLAFEQAGRRIGSLSVNIIRLVFAFAMLSLVVWLRRGEPLPLDAGAHQWTWLLLSGAVGYGFGDLCLFRAFVLLGARLATLLMAVTPVLTTAIGWVALGERLHAVDLVAIALVCAGIGWALLSRAAGDAPLRAPSPLGVMLGLGGALGQAGGLVLSKHGMDGYDPFASGQIRVISGFAVFALLFTGLRWWPRVGSALRDARGLGYTALGALFGPFLGVTVALVAVQDTNTGVAATLMATTPLVVLAYVALVRREPVGLGGLCGSVLAVVGVALLFLA